MTSRTPVVRQVSRGAVFFQITITVALCVAARIVFGHLGLVAALALLLTYSYGSRYLVARFHRAGVSLVKQKRYLDAIPLFERSLAYFDSHPGIDNYRAIVLLSSSAISYREMALANIGFCHAQAGNGAAARAAYERCLEQFPESGLATSALRMMDAGIKKSDAEETVSDQPDTDKPAHYQE